MSVIAGLVPATPINGARPCHCDRGGRDKPGHDQRWRRAYAAFAFTSFTSVKTMPGARSRV